MLEPVRLLEHPLPSRLKTKLPKTKCKTLWSYAPSLEVIHASIVKFYCGSTVTLTEVSPTEWSVATGKGLCANMRVILKGGRYRFENTETA